MATLGQTLKSTREAKGLSTSESAAATRIKIQHIEAIEQDDFSKIPAPAYAKGFIKLYAEHLGLDPGPFVEAYMQYYAPKDKGPINPTDFPDEKDQESGGRKKLKWLNAYKIPGKVRNMVSDSLRKMILMIVGIIILLVIIISGYRSCGSDQQLSDGKSPGAAVWESKPVGALISDPADTYLEPKRP